MKTCSRRLFLTSCLAAVCLPGCGYQLRGLHSEKTLPYRTVMITSHGADAELVRQLKRVLIAFGADIVDTPDLAEIEVLLPSSNYRSVTSAIGSYGEISARMVVLSQPIKIRRIHDDHWLVDTLVRRSRDVDQTTSLSTSTSTLGPERPLAIARESEEVTADVRARVVDGIVTIVQRLSPLTVSP